MLKQQNDILTKWQNTAMIKKRNVKMWKWQTPPYDKTPKWHNAKRTTQQNDKITDHLNDKTVKWHNDKMTKQQNDKMLK
jgi:hypothetical protein